MRFMGIVIIILIIGAFIQSFLHSTHGKLNDFDKLFGGLYTISFIILTIYSIIKYGILCLLIIPLTFFVSNLIFSIACDKLFCKVNKSINKNKKNKKVSKTTFINKKLLITILILLFIVISIIIATNNKNSNNNTTNNSNTNKTNENYKIKNINSQKEFNNAILNSEYSIILFGYDECVYCNLALPTLESLAKDYKLNNVYYYDVSNDNINVDIELEKLPVVAIYKNNEYLAQKVGYTEQNNEISELFYRMEIIELLENNNVID